MGPLTKVAASWSTLVPNLRYRWLGFLAAGTRPQTGHGAHRTQDTHTQTEHYLGTWAPWGTTSGLRVHRMGVWTLFPVFVALFPPIVFLFSYSSSAGLTSMHTYTHTQQREASQNDRWDPAELSTWSYTVHTRSERCGLMRCFAYFLPTCRRCRALAIGFELPGIPSPPANTVHSQSCPAAQDTRYTTT